jgi:hypothetical protein
MTAFLAGGEDNDEVVLMQQPCEPSAFSIWLREHALDHCEEIMSAEGFESLMHLQMLQGKDAGTIRTLISGMKGHRRGYCAGMILLRYGPLTGCTMEG